MFDSKTLAMLSKREIIGHPENRDDREQFIHLREYRWNASRIVPMKVVKNILAIVDQVEGTQSLYLFKVKLPCMLVYLKVFTCLTMSSFSILTE